MKKHYQILSGLPDRLQAVVNTKLADGYTLVGGPIEFQGGVLQAVIKDNLDDGEISPTGKARQELLDEYK